MLLLCGLNWKKLLIYAWMLLYDSLEKVLDMYLVVVLDESWWMSRARPVTVRDVLEQLDELCRVLWNVLASMECLVRELK